MHSQVKVTILLLLETAPQFLQAITVKYVDYDAIIYATANTMKKSMMPQQCSVLVC